MMQEKFEVLALTDVSPFYTEPDGAGGFLAHKTLSAFKPVSTGRVQEGLFELAARLPADRVHLYAHALPVDAIVRAWVTRDRGTLTLVSLPEPADDSDLRTLLAQQTGETGFDDPALGRFVLDRMACVYRAQAEWLGRPVTLEVENAEEDGPRDTLRACLRDAAVWDERLRETMAACGLTDAALDSVAVDEAGALIFWLTAGEKIVSVTADPAGGEPDVSVIDLP